MRPSFLSLRSYFQTTSDFAITYLKNKGLQPNIDDIFGNMAQRNVLKKWIGQKRSRSETMLLNVILKKMGSSNQTLNRNLYKNTVSNMEILLLLYQKKGIAYNA